MLLTLRNYILPVLLAMNFLSCKKETKFNDTIINESYSIAIPEYITPTTGMHEKASVQYVNEEKEFYLLVGIMM